MPVRLALRGNLSQSIFMRSAASLRKLPAGRGIERHTLSRNAGEAVRSSLGGVPFPQTVHEHERTGLVGVGQMFARSARKTLDQRLLVALLVRLERDCGDYDKDALLAAVVSLRGPHFGAPRERVRECHYNLPRARYPAQHRGSAPRGRVKPLCLSTEA